MIRLGKETDKETLMRLWRLCFPEDSRHFVRFYFNKIYTNDETLVYVESNHPVASMQIIPFQIKTGSLISWGGYISGAMTHPDYRNRGYMAQLLTASFDYMQKKGYAYTFLIPQDEHLVDFYKKFGYENAFPEYFTSYRCTKESKLTANITIHTDFSTVDVQALYTSYSHWLMEKANVVLKSEYQFANILWDFFNEKGVMFVSSAGFAFSSKYGKSIDLIDFFYRNEETKIEFLQTISAYYSGKGTITYNDPAILTPEYKGMIKSLAESVAAETDIYMGRMFE